MTSRAFAVAALLMAVATLCPPPLAAAEAATASDRNRDASDIDKLVKSYATLSRHADGTTSVTPASAALRALIEAEYEAEGRLGPQKS